MRQRQPLLRRLTCVALLVLAPACESSGGNRWVESGRSALERARALRPVEGRARNVVLFVGDGMGLSTVTAARILQGQLRGEPGEGNLLRFERLPYVALAKTYNTNQQTPDSAGTMTALVTGSKTRAGVLSVDESVPRGDHRAVADHRLRTLLERAEQRGLSTGVVSTTSVTHATPAACYAHSPERDWQNDADLPEAARADDFPDIARQLVELRVGDGLEVALGGGRQDFLPREVQDPERPERSGSRRDGRDLTAEWVARRPGAAYVWKLEQLRALDLQQTRHLLGLFEPSHMQWEVDRGSDLAGEPSLSEMTRVALEILSRNPKGFFLMVEAGRIDHAHHASNAHRALVDTIELDRAVGVALEKTSADETLVIVTADHDHTLAIAGYPTRGNPILGLVVGNDERGEPRSEPALDASGLPYTTLGYLNGPGYTGASPAQPEGAKRFPHFPPTQAGVTRGRPDLSQVETGDASYLQESAVPLRAETHSGEDVPIYAGGPGAHLLHGVQEQSYVYHVMEAALGWR